MVKFLIKRLLLFFPVVLGVSTLVFFMIHLIPGDPIDIMLGDTARDTDKEALRIELHLNEPIVTQYFSFLKGLIRGEMGRSLHTMRPVTDMIIERLPATIELTITSMLFAIIIAVPSGIIGALRQHSIFDYGSMIFAMLGISMPNFWLGPLLIIFFGLYLGWFPVSGKDGLIYFVLPSITLGTGMAAILARMIRANLLEVINKEYLVCARAKGLKMSSILLKHAARNALIPVITVLGLQFGSLLGGSIITETIFSWPGIGRLTIQAINTRDYPLVQGCILIISLSYVSINLLTDIVYTYIDPRIEY
ncbi:MAG: nickel ABC transporter permease [Nitrospirota bacterium]